METKYLITITVITCLLVFAYQITRKSRSERKQIKKLKKAMAKAVKSMAKRYKGVV
jgi:hypothetical protein